MRSVIAELRERFQSHSMRSYRSRFQKIYELCMCLNASPFLGMDQLSHFPNLQQWLGLAVAGNVELGHIVDPPVVRMATAIVPLGWTGVPGEKNGEPLKVDVAGYGLHLCTLVQARVNGNWCSTIVETLPSTPAYSFNNGIGPDLQKMRILIGAPLKRPPKHQIVADSLMPGFPSSDSDSINPQKYNIESFGEGENIHANGLNDVFICCTSDFITTSKAVYIRTRRVRLLGLEGAGKTSLFNAILGQNKQTVGDIESVLPDVGTQERLAGGLFYIDSAGVNLQELHSEVARFRDELWMGVHDLSKKIDLIVLVHNLSHKIPTYHQQNATHTQPALSLILNEAKVLGIPWVLAITNKFSVSAHQQKSAVNAILQAYQASPRTTEVINSCPYVTPSSGGDPGSWDSVEGNDYSKGRMAAQNLLRAPINLVRMPFQKKSVVLPVEGVNALCQLIHQELHRQEEASLQELARERLLLELAREQERAANASRDSQNKANSLTAAAVGASLGAGVGLVLAVVMGAASALRKP